MDTLIKEAKKKSRNSLKKVVPPARFDLAAPGLGKRIKRTSFWLEIQQHIELTNKYRFLDFPYIPVFYPIFCMFGYVLATFRS
jgi:hypothetical protein